MVDTIETYNKIAANIDKITELSCENDKLLWNAAIEQAAKVAEFNMDETVPFKIRSLKK